MITPILKLYAVPVALLVMAGGLAAPHAVAEGTTKSFQAALTYNAKAPAANIYADLKRAAERACAAAGTRSLHVRVQEQQCAADLLKAAVEKIARPDVAQVLHANTDAG